MPRGRKANGAASSPKANDENGELGFEATLCSAADTLRGSMDASEHKHPVLGLIFLKSISVAFEELHAQLAADRESNAEDSIEGENPRLRGVLPKEYAKPSLGSTRLGQLVDQLRDFERTVTVCRCA